MLIVFLLYYFVINTTILKISIFIIYNITGFCLLPAGKVFAEQININSAILSQLDELTGIGPKYAQAIINDRPFLRLMIY